MKEEADADQGGAESSGARVSQSGDRAVADTDGQTGHGRASAPPTSRSNTAAGTEGRRGLGDECA